MPITAIRVGATKKIRVYVKYDGEPLDISSDTVTYMLKENETDEDAKALVNVNADVSQGAQGIANITIPKSTTEGLEVGKRYFEIFIVRADGTEYVLRSGIVYVIGRITDI